MKRIVFGVFRKKIAAALSVGMLALLTVGIAIPLAWGEDSPVDAAGGTLSQTDSSSRAETGYIKYVEFNVPLSALEKALKADIDRHDTDRPQSWIPMLAYLGAKYGGDFSRYQSKDLDALLEKLDGGASMEELTADMQYYPYYEEAYTAVLGGKVGSYRMETESGEWEERYGLIAFSPIARTFPFEHYDDFGVQRTYGYTRRHLGHDLMAATGTPVIAVEGGTVEALGWNEYGGWRIGIRSHDKKRYYYYAHLRQNRPYAEGLQEGQEVKAGDVIGYVGHTGYSLEENVNNITISHLHFGMQLIFDESQKDSNNEIWINLYPLTQLLQKHTSEVVRDSETKEYRRKYEIEILPDKTGAE